MAFEGTRRRRARRNGCKRNQAGGGTQSYGFGTDLGPRGAGLGAAEVVTQQYTTIPRPGMAIMSDPTGLPFGSGLMRGGRYSVNVGSVLAEEAGVAAPVIQRGPACEDPNAAAKIWPARGGAAPLTMNPMLREQTAGYEFGVDKQLSAAGTPITIQVPVDARAVSPNCANVKGGRRRRTARKGRKARKTARRAATRKGSKRSNRRRGSKKSRK